jgi:UDP-glucose 4-epimerase
MANYLVTGGAGFIGSNLTNFLAKENHVVVVDDLSMGKMENLDSSANIEFIKGSITGVTLMRNLLKKKSLIIFFIWLRLLLLQILWKILFERIR